MPDADRVGIEPVIGADAGADADADAKDGTPCMLAKVALMSA
jgi:hypothetical protein